MKNLFSIDRTGSEFAERIDDNPFITQRLSDEKLAEVEDIRLQVIGRDETRPRVKTSPWLWVGIALLLLAVVPVFILRDKMFADGRLWLAVVDLCVLIMSAVCLAVAGRVQKRDLAETYNRESEIDFEEAMNRMNRLTTDARKELHVPNRTTEVDVLPFLYTVTGKGKKPLGKKNVFDNVPVDVWRYGDDLNLSDCRCVLSVPVSSILGYNTYDQPLTVMTWVKSVSCDSARYKRFNLHSFGMMSVRGRGYHGIVIRAENGDTYELLIPCWDLPELEKLIDLHELNAPEA